MVHALKIKRRACAAQTWCRVLSMALDEEITPLVDGRLTSFLDLDHILAVAMMGLDVIGNMALMSSTANRSLQDQVTLAKKKVVGAISWEAADRCNKGELERKLREPHPRKRRRRVIAKENGNT